MAFALISVASTLGDGFAVAGERRLGALEALLWAEKGLSGGDLRKYRTTSVSWGLESGHW